MTNLQEMQALQDAHVILHGAACQVAAGTKAVWTILHHAQQHINRQMTDLLGDTELEVGVMATSIRCDQCQLVMIQGVLCHETGCVNTYSRYDAESGEWVKRRKCGGCGCSVDADDLCCDAEVEDEEEVETCDDCGEPLDECECGDEEDAFEHEDSESLEDRGRTLGS